MEPAKAFFVAFDYFSDALTEIDALLPAILDRAFKGEL